MSDLSIKTTRSMMWSLAENFGLRGVQLVISIILARLLLPEQFGLIGMLSIFMALAQSILDSGYGSALIQKKDANELDFNSVFYFNIMVGIFLTILMCVSAPWISDFFDEPLLLPMVQFLSLNIVINGLALVPTVILTKRMDFKGVLKVSVIAALLSGAIGVAMAMSGWGVWSLVAQSIASSLFRAILLWWASRWWPRLLFSIVSLRTMFGYGSRMLASGLLATLFSNIYQPLVGKLYGAADVGFFVRAQTLQAVAIQPSGTALDRVLFPAMSTIQDNPLRLKRALRNALSLVTYFHFPLMVGLAASAHALLTLMLTDRWAASIPYFQLFCMAGILYPLHVINLAVLKAVGRSDLFFRLELAKKVISILAIVLTIRWGITGLLYGQIGASIIAFFMNSYYSGPLVDYDAKSQMQDFLPALILSFCAGGAMALAGLWVQPLVLQLIVQIVTGAITYLALSYLFTRSTLVEITHLARRTLGIPAPARLPT